MKEQEADEGDLPAVRAAMKILGASCVETLDTKGTDGSNVHLGGPETLTGYFGGIGQPNGHPLQWVDEALYYYVNYGVDEVLNISLPHLSLRPKTDPVPPGSGQKCSCQTPRNAVQCTESVQQNEYSSPAAQFPGQFCTSAPG